MSLFDQYSIDNINRENLLTEENNKRSKDIDVLDTHSLVSIFIEEDKKPQQAVSNAKNEIANAIEEISKRLKNNGRLFYIGAGTSGRLAVLDAAECPPTFCTSPELVQALIAGGPSALIKSAEGIEDSITESILDLKKRNFSSKDTLIGITAGGTTPYVLSALKYSKEINAFNLVITCVPAEQAVFNSDIVIRLLTGPEIIPGSTRLKAATATKMTLNIISTGIMIRLGKIFKNKMVDLSITNSKLLDRSIRILKDLLNIDRAEAFGLLKSSNGSVKISCIMKLTGLSCKKANLILDQHQSNLHSCLSALGVDMSQF
ncbi:MULTISPECIES: N-acetylmuramic acid 6-phosphate etherase [unclassified Prochlorococcus]|uniref:N-acetylmuramic acid 6-phosphate etherase n=1 Tax=unclassified Prochlorococcus TaxID=2627481 RepID=UPI0005336E14|nr:MULTISPECIES: N-acetylmuramic acid 6-phosphate etherase [unclassified Prochlorococcus]KGG15264.1 N-acetylmuramic acid 6-phosphate etherase [Prochlorococcus sp. MIT 0602]KGG17541.1 N-acetylmuramic acid 6-phosphate etherase [Prochlorococcus sp. MIT 0603]